MSEIIVSQSSSLNPNRTLPDWERAFAFWLDEFQSPRTRENYRRVWTAFLAWSGGLHPGEVEHEHIRLYKHHLQQSKDAGGKGFSTGSVNVHLSGLSSFYRFVNERYAFLRDDNPCEGVKHLKVNPYGKATHLVDEQDKRLLSSINLSTDIGKRDYAIIILFLTTGVRLSAVAEATFADLRVTGDVMFLNYVNKGGEDKNKRLAPNAVRAVNRWLAVRGLHDGSLFGLSRRMIQHMVLTRCNGVFGKGHGITVHSLRHSAAMNASESGATFQEVKALLDHKSARVTAVYLEHMSTGSDRISVKLDERYG